MYTCWLIDRLRCPETQKTLKHEGNCFRSDGKVYEIKNDILSIVYPDDLVGYDAKYNRIYNLFAPLYDLNERVMGKLLVGVDMIKGRKQIISFLGLKSGMKVLEVSPGPGVFQKFLPFADNSFDALYHFGGINLFNDPQKAISEFIRVVKKDGIVSWGDEGFSENYRNERRKKMMLRINPGFAKPRPEVPDSVYDIKENEVYDGLAYLVVARKR